MESKLSGKQILIVKGSLLSDTELRDALVRSGAGVTVTNNLISAFDLIGRRSFDGAIVDHGLHNEAFDLCTEFQALNIPYISANVPHRVQGLSARERDADITAARLTNMIESENLYAQETLDFIPVDDMPAELRAL